MRKRNIFLLNSQTGSYTALRYLNAFTLPRKQLSIVESYRGLPKISYHQRLLFGLSSGVQAARMRSPANRKWLKSRQRLPPMAAPDQVLRIFLGTVCIYNYLFSR